MQLSDIGIDLGKTSCSLVGLDAGGKVVLCRRMRRDTVIAFCSKFPACVVAMEACCGAHQIGRALAGQGHEIRLTSPEDVRPHTQGAEERRPRRRGHRGSREPADYALRDAEVGGAA